MNDAISDMLNRIYTNALVGNKTASFPLTKTTEAVTNLLKKEGYIESIVKTGKKNIKTIEVEISYDVLSGEFGAGEKTKAAFEGFKRISKPSRRVYVGVNDFKFDRKDRTMRVLSTPKGILSERDAREARVGGELLFEIW